MSTAQDKKDAQTYKKLATEGMDLMWPVKLKGKANRPDIGIAYHVTIMLFDVKNDTPEEAHKIASKLDLHTPDAKELKVDLATMKGRTGYNLYNINLNGPETKRIEELYREFSSMGYHNGYKFQAHITVDKDTWDEFKSDNGKTAEEAGIEFLPAQLRQGDEVVEDYGGLNKSEKDTDIRKNEMRITPEEIDKVEEAGTMNGGPVKLIRTKGGFWIAIGRKKGKNSEEALTAGSHSAIVKYNMEKQFPDFQPNLMKSEGAVEAIVNKHSHYLSDDLKKSGHDIYSIQTGDSVEFHITHGNSQIAKVTGSLDKSHLYITELSIPKQFAAAMAGATVEKAVSCEVGLKLKR